MAEPQHNEPPARVCHWHPETSTGLWCGQCRRAICTLCLVQAPVGIRCRECGRAQPLPTFDVRPANYARAAGVAAAIVILGALLWVGLSLVNPYLTRLVMPLLIGYAMGDLVSRAVNLKRSRGLMFIAGGGVLLSCLVGMILASILIGVPITLGLWGLLAFGGGVLIAIGRVRL